MAWILTVLENSVFPNYALCVCLCVYVCVLVVPEKKKDWKEIHQNVGVVEGFCFDFILFHIFQIFYYESYCFHNQKISSKLNANSFLISS